MNNFSVKIHEFSTGINSRVAADGKVISEGFKVGEVGNSTLHQIPPAVKRSIANKEFAVAESAYSDSPAVIGRDVLGSNGEENWSVVAVVTKFGDDRDRSFSAYRYFLCKEPNSLGIILAWMESYRQQLGDLPVFNPNETKTIGQPNLGNSIYTSNSSLSDEDRNWVRSETVPIIIPSESVYNLQEINEMAAIKAAEQPVSWAYNVEAIERADKFIIIKAASNEAFDLIKRSRDAQMLQPRVLAPGVDENALETAVKGLINSSQVKLKNLETIIANLDPNKVNVNKEYWEHIFKELGADNTIESGSSHQNGVRLLTLRAIVIPETLPEFLDWLTRNVNPGDTKRTTSVKFQSQLINYFTALEPNIDKGIKIALEKLVDARRTVPQVPVEAHAWLLNAPNGLWSLYRPYLIEDVTTDLETIKTSFETLPYQISASNFRCGQSIWRALQSSRTQKISSYEPLANLFYELSKYDLAAYFYQVSYGKVPKEIFNKAYGNRRWEATSYGRKVIREATLLEKIVIWAEEHPAIIIRVVLLISFLLFVGGNNVKIAIFAFASILSLLEWLANATGKKAIVAARVSLLVMLILSLGNWVVNKINFKSLLKPLQSLTNQPSTTASPSPSGSPQASMTASPRSIITPRGNKPANNGMPPKKEMPSDKLKEAKQKFSNQTKPALTQLVQELKQDQELAGITEKEISKTINETLKIQENEFDYAAALESQDRKQIEILSEAIYSYQTRNRDGIIVPGGNTFKKLKEEVKAKLKSNPQNERG